MFCFMNVSLFPLINWSIGKRLLYIFAHNQEEWKQQGTFCKMHLSIYFMLYIYIYIYLFIWRILLEAGCALEPKMMVCAVSIFPLLPLPCSFYFYSSLVPILFRLSLFCLYFTLCSSKDGRTPLKMALSSENYACVRALLDYGADVNKKNVRN